MKNKGMKLLLILIILTTTLLSPFKVKAETNYVKIETFIRQLVQAMKLDVDSTVKEPYIDAALKAGILKSDQFTDYEGYITTTDAAVLLNRADENLNKSSLDEKLYKAVLENRISDIKQIPKEKREDVAKVVAKGIIKGYSNGKYIQNRSFKGNEYFTKTDAKVTLIRLMNPSKRAKLSPDGQLIRTTNLPKNADKYEYILESFPNSFYEKKFDYQRTKYYYEPKELVDYASPVKVIGTMRSLTVIDGKMIYLSDWTDKVRLNLSTRLNVDYKTIEKNNTWLNNLSSTYYLFERADLDKPLFDDIKEYIAFVKKNKVKIESEIISVEPSTLYDSINYYMRAYVKFKVTSPNFDKIKEDIIFYNYVSDTKPLVEGKWMECVFDVGLGTRNGSSKGRDYAVNPANIIVYPD
ncbi:S-layer homology domain-containing protein [Anaerocolumna aminovalerica]|uniref:S-layer homology domain-containing protein n=1 Tax=Anaerocolumna aminovalerica TaxID=1527 RepID=UPI00248C11CE|nr:S-layer homology domain-containing protein [Anaerocolumna aminovalerica]